MMILTLYSGFRRKDEPFWTPAFAGMTGVLDVIPWKAGIQSTYRSSGNYRLAISSDA